MGDPTLEQMFRRGYAAGWAHRAAERDFDPTASIDYPVGRPVGGATPAEACEHAWAEWWDGALGYRQTWRCTACGEYRYTPPETAEVCAWGCVFDLGHDGDCRGRDGLMIWEPDPEVSAGGGAGAAQTTTHPYRQIVSLYGATRGCHYWLDSGGQCGRVADDPIHQTTTPIEVCMKPHVDDPDECDVCGYPGISGPIHQTTTPADHIAIFDGPPLGGAE